MRVAEIFGSIDGEGIFAGALASFVRLAGCNIRCRYCDTPYALALSSGTEMSVQEVMAEVGKIGYHHVTITGGEPLWQKETPLLASALTESGYHVNIETNGTLDIAPFIRDGVTVTMDYKTPYSGQDKWMHHENLALLRDCDVLKFVIEPESDLPFVEEVLLTNHLACRVFLSPVFGTEPMKLVEFAKKIALKNPEKGAQIRVQLQLHKLIWAPDKRGV